MIYKIFGAIVGPVLFLQLAFAENNAFHIKPLSKVDPAALERGARVYKAQCIRCHNKDPNLKGSIGPDQVDAPFDVVVSKIMTGKYPDPLPKGFVPKRKSRSMAPLKALKADIPYIYAWIQSVKKKK